jgi:hypothetical protein
VSSYPHSTAAARAACAARLTPSHSHAAASNASRHNSATLGHEHVCAAPRAGQRLRCWLRLHAALTPCAWCDGLREAKSREAAVWNPRNAVHSSMTQQQAASPAPAPSTSALSHNGGSMGGRRNLEHCGSAARWDSRVAAPGQSASRRNACARRTLLQPMRQPATQRQDDHQAHAHTETARGPMLLDAAWSPRSPAPDAQPGVNVTRRTTRPAAAQSRHAVAMHRAPARPVTQSRANKGQPAALCTVVARVRTNSSLRGRRSATQSGTYAALSGPRATPAAAASGRCCGDAKFTSDAAAAILIRVWIARVRRLLASSRPAACRVRVLQTLALCCVCPGSAWATPFHDSITTSDGS